MSNRLDLTYYFQTVIKTAFDKYLQEAAPNGTLRKFSKNLGLNSGAISLILRGKRGLNYEAAEKVVTSLGLTIEQKNSFMRSLAEYKGRRFAPVSRGDVSFNTTISIDEFAGDRNYFVEFYLSQEKLVQLTPAIKKFVAELKEFSLERQSPDSSHLSFRVEKGIA